MSLIFRRRVPLRQGTHLNLSFGGVSLSQRLGRVTLNSRGRLSVRLFRGLSWRTGR